MTLHDKYDKDVLKALQRIASSLEKIEKKMSVKPTENEFIGLSVVDCFNCKHSDCHPIDQLCYTCRDGSNYVSRN